MCLLLFILKLSALPCVFDNCMAWDDDDDDAIEISFDGSCAVAGDADV